MVAVKRIQHVSITAPLDGTEVARSFYAGVLGLREKPVPASLAGLNILLWFDAGPTELHIVAEDDETRGRSRRHVCFEVDDLAAVRARLVATGYQPYDAAPIPGRPRFFCRDPFGNLLEFMVFAEE
ncbi:MAG: VOC family protein [Thermomicrobium sp.]|nr:VOC family protein [Thermomicrobium sp.]MDW8060333.1 VOC family protein [Thermomicrobium sp.]